MSTFAELQTIVSYNLGGRDDDESKAQIMFSMNLIQKILAAEHDWEELQKQATATMVVGQFAYTDAELSLVNPQKIYQVSLADGLTVYPPMYQATEIVWRKNFAPHASRPGTPDTFARFASKTNFNIAPRSAFTLTIDYFQKVTKITEPNSVISFEDKDELREGINHLTFNHANDNDISPFVSWLLREGFLELTEKDWTELKIHFAVLYKGLQADV